MIWRRLSSYGSSTCCTGDGRPVGQMIGSCRLPVSQAARIAGHKKRWPAPLDQAPLRANPARRSRPSLPPWFRGCRRGAHLAADAAVINCRVPATRSCRAGSSIRRSRRRLETGERSVACMMASGSSNAICTMSRTLRCSVAVSGPWSLRISMTRRAAASPILCSNGILIVVNGIDEPIRRLMVSVVICCAVSVWWGPLCGRPV